ncbi:HAD family hydrolase [Xanthovirga aplysinae]|uniref:HAD family hydrolase n=1 Tax=Xanthovirga aplysinae TaxID=2529853 RepID=UPI0012BD2A91|nr:HAD family hydrolase [Xanthovirga aplysinae]MTI30047.1 HAD family hydrolase [Xanthovirga aplysinae]
MITEKTNIEVIAFDADDTLWMNETIFSKAQGQYREMLQTYIEPEVLDQRFHETMIRNLQSFGYGIKNFTFSMIETAIELSYGKISGLEIQQIINLGREMLKHPVELINGVKETLHKLSKEFELMIITKGDLFDQEGKIARSGIAHYFPRVEILSEKNEMAYTNILKRYQITTEQFLMVGNSLKSDVIPVCKIGANALHIPFHITWAHEQVEEKEHQNLSYWKAKSIKEVPDLVKC